MRYYVYVLFSQKDNKLYIGSSSDLKKRIQSHADGRVRSTKDRRPFILIHYEFFIEKKEALVREKFLKSGFGRNELKKCLQITLTKLGYKHL